MDRVLPREIWRCLMCESCRKYLYPPARHCRNCGCLLCPDCVSVKTHCPQCRSNLSHIEPRQRFQQILEAYMVPCPFATCPEVGLPRYIRQHMVLCEHRPLFCPWRVYNNCAWKGTSKNQLVKHCEKGHADRVFRSNWRTVKCSKFMQCLRIADMEKCDASLALHAYNEVFRVYYETDFRNKFMLFQVCYQSQKEQHYVFDITFKKKSKCKSRRSNCDKLDQIQSYVLFNFNEIEQFRTGDNLSFTVRVAKK